MTKWTNEVTESLKDFKGRRRVDVVFSDNAEELISATRAIGTAHQPSLTGIPKSNAIVERVNYLVRDGASASLVRARAPTCYWSYAVKTFCVNYNFTEKMEDGTTPWETVSGEKFKGQLFPFCVLVVYTPSRTRDT